MNDIRKGVALVLDGEPYVVMTSEFLRKQQRRPVMKTQLKHLVTGAAREHSFQQSDKIEEAAIDRVSYQFLYGGDGEYQFMDQATYEQVTLTEDVIGEAASFLLEGQEIEVRLLDGKPVTVELPIKIDRKVVEAPPGVKGDTSTNVMKEVMVEGGAKVKAPLFVKEGDKIRIDTRTGEYVEKA